MLLLFLLRYGQLPGKAYLFQDLTVFPKWSIALVTLLIIPLYVTHSFVGLEVNVLPISNTTLIFIQIAHFFDYKFLVDFVTQYICILAVIFVPK